MSKEEQNKKIEEMIQIGYKNMKTKPITPEEIKEKVEKEKHERLGKILDRFFDNVRKGYEKKTMFITKYIRNFSDAEFNLSDDEYLMLLEVAKNQGFSVSEESLISDPTILKRARIFWE